MGNDQVAIGSGVDAIGTCDMVAGPKLRFCLLHHLAKNSVDIGVSDALLRGNFAGDLC